MDEDRGLAWRTSSLSDQLNCVEWAASHDGEHMHVRHSQDPAGPVLTFTAAEWRAFLGGVRAGEADL